MSAPGDGVVDYLVVHLFLTLCVAALAAAGVALALKPLRLRLASALPALIGARTVALLRQAGPAALTQRVKMPRHEVRALLFRMTLGLGSRAVLQRLWCQLSGEPCL